MLKVSFHTQADSPWWQKQTFWTVARSFSKSCLIINLLYSWHLYTFQGLQRWHYIYVYVQMYQWNTLYNHRMIFQFTRHLSIKLLLYCRFTISLLFNPCEINVWWILTVFTQNEWSHFNQWSQTLVQLQHELLPFIQFNVCYSSFALFPNMCFKMAKLCILHIKL